MQYWESSSRAFVDMLDSYAHLPFLDDLALARPSTLLEPDRLSILLHEYVHLVSIQGPISIFSAYQTSMSHAVQELCLLKATRDPKELHFHTIPNNHDYIYVPPETLAASAFLEQRSENLRCYVNFFNAYRWLFEGLALFVQWDYIPNPALPPSPFVRLLNSLYRAQPQHPEATWDELLAAFGSMQSTERQKRRKWSLYKSSQASTRDYFVGYLLVKRLWHSLGERDYRFRHPDLFFRFISTILLHDWGILTLCAPTGEPDVFAQEEQIKKRLQHFQEHALRQVGGMDATYLSNWVDHLVGADGPFFQTFEFRYSSSPEHENVFVIDPEQWEHEIITRLQHDITGHFEDLFRSSSTRDELRPEFERITTSSMDLFYLIRDHHKFFKIHASRCHFIGYQQIGPVVRQVLLFLDGLFCGIQNLSSDQAASLLQELQESKAPHIRFPWNEVDLSKMTALDEHRAQQALNHLADGRSLLGIKVYDLYDIESHQWVHVQVAGKQVILGIRSPGPGVLREESIRLIASRLDRASYWDRVMRPPPPKAS
jgi:hypothetical protein